VRPVTVSVTGVGSSSVIPVDHYASTSTIALAVVVSGTVTYTVQHTFDDVFASTFVPASATWIDHATLAAQTTTKDGNYAYPPRAVRVTNTAGTGTSTLILNQVGIT